MAPDRIGRWLTAERGLQLDFASDPPPPADWRKGNRRNGCAPGSTGSFEMRGGYVEQDAYGL